MAHIHLHQLFLRQMLIHFQNLSPVQLLQLLQAAADLVDPQAVDLAAEAVEVGNIISPLVRPQ